MATYTARMYHEPIDVHMFGNYWADRLEAMLIDSAQRGGE